jgi:ATP-dependent DNA helicase PIF1
MNEKQLEAFNLIISGENIFLSGAAGCGKSYMLTYLKNYWHKNRINALITATTGSASLLISGKTIFSALGIGLGKKAATILYEDIKKKNKKLIQKISLIEVLVIDEISMMDAELFDKINEILQLIRKNHSLFGGLQVVLLGDFAQLPPINGKYCFLSNSWKIMNIITIELTQIMRQQNNEEFIKMLQELRWGNCTTDIIKELKKLKNTEFPQDNIKPTLLYCKNVDVDTINNHEYKLLLSNNPRYKLFNTNYCNNLPSVKYWAQSLKIPESVELCEGAQVMVTWNIDLENGIANGTRGIVDSFTNTGVNIITTNKNKVLITYISVEDEGLKLHFMPLRLAWATTIHKSQGCTIDRVIINIEDSWDYGQSYVALSRARSMSDIKIIGEVKSKSFKCSKDVKEFYGQ